MALSTVTLEEIDHATNRVIRTAARLTDADIGAPSLLPGWTRGHVLAHIARHADSTVNLLTWARTGVETPQYASPQARDAEIERGSARPVRAQVADLEQSAERLRTAITAMPAAAWQAVVRNRAGRWLPARDLLWARLREVEVHHVDLDAGYAPARWPAAFVTGLLAEVVTDFSRRDDIAAIRLRTPDQEMVVGVGEPRVTVAGASYALAAWLIGRSDGADLTVDPAGRVPRLPAWR